MTVIDNVTGLVWFLLLLSIRIPTALFNYFASILAYSQKIKSKETPSNSLNLHQCLLVTIVQTAEETFTISLLRFFYGLSGYFDLLVHGLIGSINKWYTEVDGCGWKGYLIAEDARNVCPDSEDVDLVILYAHGGGFIAGHSLIPLAAFVYWIKAWKLTYNVNVQILSIEYPLAPEHPYPAQQDNIIRCYEWLVRVRRISPRKIVFSGDSAGGNLVAVAAIHIAHNQEKLNSLPPPPSSLLLISPCFTALTSADSFKCNAKNDLISTKWYSTCGLNYVLGTGMLPHDPLISPLQRDNISRMPRFWACVGEFEIMRDDAKAFVEKARKQGVSAELVVEPMNVHNYAVSSLISRNDAYMNAAKQMGHFLFGNKRLSKVIEHSI